MVGIAQDVIKVYRPPHPVSWHQGDENKLNKGKSWIGVLLKKT